MKTVDATTTLKNAGFQHRAGVILAAASGDSQIVSRCEARPAYRARDWRPSARKHFRERRSALMDLAEMLPLKATKGSQSVLNIVETIVVVHSCREEWVRTKLDRSFLG